MENLIKQTIGELSKEIHQNNVNSGWWHIDGGHGHKISVIEMIHNPENVIMERFAMSLIAEKLCLTHSEISEGMEGLRKNLMDDKLPHRPMLEVELADAVIRILDLSSALGFDIEGAIIEKLEFNKTRPDHKIENRNKKNGKKF